MLIAAALHLWGATEVRSDIIDVVLLVCAGAFWLFISAKLFFWLGLSFEDEVIERRNLSALIAISGGLTSVTLIYAGGNLGEGPSFIENFFSAGLGTAILLGLWFLLEWCTQISRAITEERDLASGLRLGGILLATGLVFGRALAGDWHSATATTHDLLRDAWPAIIIWLVAAIFERFVQPSHRRPFPNWPSHGLMPALAYVVFAVWWSWHLGRWEGMPR